MGLPICMVILQEEFVKRLSITVSQRCILYRQIKNVTEFPKIMHLVFELIRWSVDHKIITSVAQLER